MRPMNVRTLLLLLTLGTLLPFILLAATAAWIIATEAAPIPSPVHRLPLPAGAR